MLEWKKGEEDGSRLVFPSTVSVCAVSFCSQLAHISSPTFTVAVCALRCTILRQSAPVPDLLSSLSPFSSNSFTLLTHVFRYTLLFQVINPLKGSPF